MRIRPFLMEEWLSDYRFEVKYNLAESGMRDLSLEALLRLCGQEASCLNDLLLEDMPTTGSRYLRESIAACYGDLDPDRILVTTGTGEALFILFNTLLEAGDEVLCSLPAFQALYEVPRAIGAGLRFFEHRIEDGFRFDAETMVDMIGEKTRLVVINNPHNPTGVECDRETMQAVVDRAREVGAKLLFDEHYRFLPHDGRELIPSGIELGEDIFATGSITKCFGAMGLRVGWLIGDPDVLKSCREMRDYLTHTLSPISEKLTQLALNQRSRILAESRRILAANKEALGHFMARHREHFTYIPPQAGVVCFPRYKAELPSRELVKMMIALAGVFCLPAHSFELEGHLRIGLGPEPKIFAEALEALDEMFERL